MLQKEVMPIPDKDLWLKIAKEFTERFQFPNCVSAVVGKHIRSKKPNRSGSLLFNYKGYFSLVLLAVVYAGGKFVIVDVGSRGSNNYAGVFSRSEFGKRLIADRLGLPQDTDSDTGLLFAFVGDDAFPLRGNLMKPFPNRQLTQRKSFSIIVCHVRGIQLNALLGGFPKCGIHSCAKWMNRQSRQQMQSRPSRCSTIFLSFKKSKDRRYGTLRMRWLSHRQANQRSTDCKLQGAELPNLEWK